MEVFGRRIWEITNFLNICEAKKHRLRGSGRLFYEFSKRWGGNGEILRRVLIEYTPKKHGNKQTLMLILLNICEANKHKIRGSGRLFYEF